MSLTQRYLIWRAERVLRRAAYRERRRLANEMAAYTTQSDRDDLMAAFDRYPDRETSRYREALVLQAMRNQDYGSWPAFQSRAARGW